VHDWLGPAGEAAWRRYAELIEPPSLRLTLSNLVYVRSDPVDGAWTTALAEVELGGRRFHGFATARRAGPELRWRAVNEAAERAVWATALAVAAGPDAAHGYGVPLAPPHEPRPVPVALLRGGERRDEPGRPPVEWSSAGSAVHSAPRLAVAAAAREVLERVYFLERFHHRAMGRPVTVPPALADAPGVAVSAWYDPDVGLLSAAAFGATATPRLAMAATITDPGDLPAAVEHCLAEIFQSRAWVRRRQGRCAPRCGPVPVVDSGTRADYWCALPAESAHTVYRQLTGDSRLPAGCAVVGADQLCLAAAARLDLGAGVPTWYARVVAADHVYSIHSAAVEQRCFDGRVTGTPFHPHPLI
jgi:hypothetical protein